MESFIDLMGSVIYTEHQIQKRLKSLELQQYSSRDEEILNRITTGIALGTYVPTTEEQQQIGDFQIFMVSLMNLAAEIRSENELLISTLVYEKALQRLERFLLIEGRPEQPYQEATYDDEGYELTPEIPFISGIDPLPEYIEVTTYDENAQPVTTSVRNPEIVRDEAERNDAQIVIDSASQEVLDLYEVRNGS